LKNEIGVLLPIGHNYFRNFYQISGQDGVKILISCDYDQSFHGLLLIILIGIISQLNVTYYITSLYSNWDNLRTMCDALKIESTNYISSLTLFTLHITECNIDPNVIKCSAPTYFSGLPIIYN
jgi:hypothetical protein